MNFDQHGFGDGKSALSNILESTDTIKEYLIEEDDGDNIYLDFRKEFDTVSHYHLLLMKHFGIYIF